MRVVDARERELRWPFRPRLRLASPVTQASVALQATAARATMSRAFGPNGIKTRTTPAHRIQTIRHVFSAPTGRLTIAQAGEGQRSSQAWGTESTRRKRGLKARLNHRSRTIEHIATRYGTWSGGFDVALQATIPTPTFGIPGLRGPSGHCSPGYDEAPRWGDATTICITHAHSDYNCPEPCINI